jgi:2-methylisocitrate lyase-like PEP mutase family enzyme
MIWKEALKNAPLLLPSAHNALTARLIERVGFPAYQIGNFSLIAANLGLPDVDLVHFGELLPHVKEILSSSSLPCLIDCDNGYGDIKMSIRTLTGYESIGAAALFIEDQQSPKKCGHMSGKEVISQTEMENKIKAARRELKKETFLLARTDAYSVEGLEGAINRGKGYLNAGADGIYFEGFTSESELEQAGKNFEKIPLALSILENGGKTPWIPAKVLYEMGYSMILYPTTILFREILATITALENLKMGYELNEGVNLSWCESILDIDRWKALESE